METPDPPSDTPGASRQVDLTPQTDIPKILRVGKYTVRPMKILCDRLAEIWLNHMLNSLVLNKNAAKSHVPGRKKDAKRRFEEFEIPMVKPSPDYTTLKHPLEK